MLFSGQLKKFKIVFAVMAFLIFYTGITPTNISALPISSSDVFSGQISAERKINEEKIASLLNSEIIEKKLTEIGLSRQEVENKLAGLTDEQINTLANKIDTIQAGGSAGWIIAVLVVLALIGMLFFFTTHDVKVTPRDGGR